MAGNDGGSSSRADGESISSADNRFPQFERRSRWRGCLGRFSCFGSKKGVQRIVPASRLPDGNVSANNGSTSQSSVLPNQNTSLLAPPSSPASFTNSALPSTAQSPSCFLSISANSPGGPSNTMFATGPYAHETQPVSPPVFSTYTTEPSTAPLTPPPELAHLTTPSSPDVPYARFLSSTIDLKAGVKENGMPFMSPNYVAGSDLQATYPLYPGSPSSSLISPASGTPRTGVSSPFLELEVPTRWGSMFSGRDSPYSTNGSSKLFGIETTSSRNFMLSSDSSFFCPATSAQFFLDQAQQSLSSYSHCGGRPSVSKQADTYSNTGNRHNKTSNQDVEEIEAYRASFGFSADEIITTQNYVEIADGLHDNFTIVPVANDGPCLGQYPVAESTNGHIETSRALPNVMDPESPKLEANVKDLETSHASAGSKPNCTSDVLLLPNGSESALVLNDEENTHKISKTLTSSRLKLGQSCSDAEIDYRRVRSLKETNCTLAWQRSSP